MGFDLLRRDFLDSDEEVPQPGQHFKLWYRFEGRNPTMSAFRHELEAQGALVGGDECFDPSLPRSFAWDAEKIHSQCVQTVDGWQVFPKAITGSLAVLSEQPVTLDPEDVALPQEHEVSHPIASEGGTGPVTITVGIDADHIEMIAGRAAAIAVGQIAERAGRGAWPEWMPLDVAGRLPRPVGSRHPEAVRTPEGAPLPGRPDAKVWLRRSELDEYMEANGL